MLEERVLEMNSQTILDSVILQLTPTRIRCELYVVVGNETNKLASGLLKPFLCHVQRIEEQVAKGGYSIRLQPPPECSDKSWFTKGTVERLVRYVNNPELLERVSYIHMELEQLEETVKMQTRRSSAGVDMTLYEVNDPSTFLSSVSSPGVETPLMPAHELEVEENSKMRLLRALVARRTVLQKEQDMSFAGVAASGFDMAHLLKLISFSDFFGAARLRQACTRFLALCKKRPESGFCLNKMDPLDFLCIPKESALKEFSREDVATANLALITRPQRAIGKKRIYGGDGQVNSGEESIRCHDREYAFTETGDPFKGDERCSSSLKSARIGADICNSMHSNIETCPSLPGILCNDKPGNLEPSRPCVRDVIGMFEKKCQREPIGVEVAGLKKGIKAGSLKPTKSVLERWSTTSDVKAELGERKTCGWGENLSGIMKSGENECAERGKGFLQERDTNHPMQHNAATTNIGGQLNLLTESARAKNFQDFCEPPVQDQAEMNKDMMYDGLKLPKHDLYDVKPVILSTCLRENYDERTGVCVSEGCGCASLDVGLKDESQQDMRSSIGSSCDPLHSPIKTKPTIITEAAPPQFPMKCKDVLLQDQMQVDARAPMKPANTKGIDHGGNTHTTNSRPLVSTMGPSTIPRQSEERVKQFLSQYHEKREAKRREDARAGRRDKHTKITAVQEDSEKKKEDIGKSTHRTEKVNLLAEAHLRANKLRAYKAELQRTRKEKEEQDKRRLEELKVRRRERATMRSSVSPFSAASTMTSPQQFRVPSGASGPSPSDKWSPRSRKATPITGNKPLHERHKNEALTSNPQRSLVSKRLENPLFKSAPLSKDKRINTIRPSTSCEPPTHAKCFNQNGSPFPLRNKSAALGKVAATKKVPASLESAHDRKGKESLAGNASKGLSSPAKESKVHTQTNTKCSAKKGTDTGYEEKKGGLKPNVPSGNRKLAKEHVAKGRDALKETNKSQRSRKVEKGGESSQAIAVASSLSASLHYGNNVSQSSRPMRQCEESQPASPKELHEGKLNDGFTFHRTPSSEREEIFSLLTCESSPCTPTLRHQRRLLPNTPATDSSTPVKSKGKLQNLLGEVSFSKTDPDASKTPFSSRHPPLNMSSESTADISCTPKSSYAQHDFHISLSAGSRVSNVPRGESREARTKWGTGSGYVSFFDLNPSPNGHGKDLKRILRFGRKSVHSSGHSSLDQASASITSEGDDDAAVSRELGSDIVDCIGRRKIWNGRLFNLRASTSDMHYYSASVVDSYETSMCLKRSISAQEVDSKAQEPTFSKSSGTSKASRSFFFLAPFRRKSSQHRSR